MNTNSLTLAPVEATDQLCGPVALLLVGGWGEGPLNGVCMGTRVSCKQWQSLVGTEL